MKKSILSLTLASCILTSTAYPMGWFGARPPLPFHLKTLAVLAKATRTVLVTWKRLDRSAPVVTKSLTFVGAAAAYQLLKVPTHKLFKNLWKKHIVKILPKRIADLFKDDIEKERANFFEAAKPKKTMSDLVEGSFHSELEELLDMVVQNYEQKPIMLYGAPGTGKSLQAEVFASEVAKRTKSNVVVLKTSGASFLSKWVGETPKKVRKILNESKKLSSDDKRNAWNLYNLLRKEQKVVIIVDELLSLANGTSSKSSGYGWAAVEELQKSLDDVFPSKNRFFIATTNSTNFPKAVIRRFQLIRFHETAIEDKIETFKFHIKKLYKERNNKDMNDLAFDNATPEITEILTTNISEKTKKEIQNIMQLKEDGYQEFLGYLKRINKDITRSYMSDAAPKVLYYANGKEPEKKHILLGFLKILFQYAQAENEESKRYTNYQDEVLQKRIFNTPKHSDEQDTRVIELEQQIAALSKRFEENQKKENIIKTRYDQEKESFIKLKNTLRKKPIIEVIKDSQEEDEYPESILEYYDKINLRKQNTLRNHHAQEEQIVILEKD